MHSPAHDPVGGSLALSPHNMATTGKGSQNQSQKLVVTSSLIPVSCPHLQAASLALKYTEYRSHPLFMLFCLMRQYNTNLTSILWFVCVLLATGFQSSESKMPYITNLHPAVTAVCNKPRDAQFRMFIKSVA